MQIDKNYLNNQKDKHLHSPDHVLADELSNRLNDPKNFGFYLKTATAYDHNILRRIAGEVLEKKAQKPGALFAYLLKKHNQENNRSTGHSLWLMPSEPEYGLLKNTKDNFSATYKSPKIEPHITLLRGLKSNMGILHAQAINFAAKQKSLVLSLLSVQTEPIYFKSFYLQVEPTKELLKARRLARKIFDDKALGKYQPHLSLMYGNFAEKIKLEMTNNFTQPLPLTIKIEEVALVKTDGQASQFIIIDKFKLQP